MSTPEPITVVDTLVIKVDRTDAFDPWLADFRRALREHAGSDGFVVRLDQAGGIVHLLYRLADREALDAWTASDRRGILATAAERFATTRQQTAVDPQPRFGLPSEASAPKWKRVLVSWATVFPLLLATSYASQALVPRWPRPLTLALSSLAITLVLNLLIFPRVNRRLDPWLLEDDDGGVRTPKR